MVAYNLQHHSDFRIVENKSSNSTYQTQTLLQLYYVSVMRFQHFDDNSYILYNDFTYSEAFHCFSCRFRRLIPDKTFSIKIVNMSKNLYKILEYA